MRSLFNINEAARSIQFNDGAGKSFREREYIGQRSRFDEENSLRDRQSNAKAVGRPRESKFNPKSIQQPASGNIDPRSISESEILALVNTATKKSINQFAVEA
jgi:hypothetical protein